MIDEFMDSEVNMNEISEYNMQPYSYYDNHYTYTNEVVHRGERI